MNISTIAIMVGCWMAFQLVTYGLSAWVLKVSKDWREDLWWMVLVFGLPFALCEWLWLQAWRTGLGADMKMWSMLVIALSCSVVGSALSMLIYFRAWPSGMSLVGLGVAVVGAAIAVIYR